MLSKKESFLALDIGSATVRAFGMSGKDGAPKSCLHSETGGTTTENIINAVDAVEKKLGAQARGAFITGNFGTVGSQILRNSLSFPKPHKIGDNDVYNAIFNSPDVRGDAAQTLHLIPLQFVIDGTDAAGAVGAFCNNFSVRFNSITYPAEAINEIKKGLMSACFPALGFFDPIYMLGKTYHRKGAAVFMDFGKTKTAAGAYMDRGMVQRFDVNLGQDEVTKIIADDFGVDYKDAEDIKLAVLASAPAASDEYVAADPKYNSLTRADVWNAWHDANERIIGEITNRVKIADAEIFITGAGTNPDNINALILRNKGLDAIVLDEFAVAGSFGKMFMKDMGRKRARAGAPKTVPVIPSVMCWNFKSAHVYKMFEAVGMRRIHADIMDGFYTDRVSGTLDDLAAMRARTRLFLHAHLMVEDPLPWLDGAIAAGADMILVSTGARNIVESLKKIKARGKFAGLAIHPDFKLADLRPELLTMLDEVMVMGVKPGASGQKFISGTAKKIKTLANTRAKYGFRYGISADGGITPETARECWAAGADFLVSGSFLHDAPDFADAVLALLPKR